MTSLTAVEDELHNIIIFRCTVHSLEGSTQVGG